MCMDPWISMESTFLVYAHAYTCILFSSSKNSLLRFPLDQIYNYKDSQNWYENFYEFF